MGRGIHDALWMILASWGGRRGAHETIGRASFQLRSRRCFEDWRGLPHADARRITREAPNLFAACVRRLDAGYAKSLLGYDGNECLGLARAGINVVAVFIPALLLDVAVQTNDLAGGWLTRLNYTTWFHDLRRSIGITAPEDDGELQTLMCDVCALLTSGVIVLIGRLMMSHRRRAASKVEPARNLFVSVQR